MFYFLTDIFGQDSFFRIFNYVTFRTLMAGLTSMLFSFYLGNKIILILKNLKFKENIRIEGPSSHQSKKGTPTMGGLMMVISMLISVILWANLTNLSILVLCIASFLFSMIGFRDDYMKAVKNIKGGMRAKTKFLLSVLLAFLFCVYFFNFSEVISTGKIEFKLTDLFIPFFKNPLLSLGIFSIPFSMFVIIGTTHAVNLTDGLDGLATGNALIVIVTFGIIAYVTGTPVAANYLNIAYLPQAHEYTVFLSALAGSLIGFLWFNSYPAQVFMGDTGSLFLGSTIGMIAILIKKEILLIILGGVFVIETLSVILQVFFFKWKKKRIFLMAPIHHHFELKGIPETKVVIRFWIAGVILSIIALSTLKIQ